MSLLFPWAAGDIILGSITHYIFCAPRFLLATQPLLLEAAVRIIGHGGIESPRPLFQAHVWFQSPPGHPGSASTLCVSASFHMVDFLAFTGLFFHFLFQAWLCSYNYMFEARRWIPCANTFYHIYLKTSVSSCQLTYGSTLVWLNCLIVMKNPLSKDSKFADSSVF